MENSQSIIKEVHLIIISAFRNHYKALLMLITAIGFFSRFSGLVAAPLTSEEVAGASIASASIPQIWTIVDSGTVIHPPLYYWIQHFLLMPGKTEFSIRFLPALCGVLSIPATYLLGKEFHSRSVGIVAAAIIAVSPYHISCSQYGAPYTMMLLISLVSLVFFVRMIKTDNGAAGAYFGLFSGLALWVTFYSVVLTFSLVLYEFVERRRRLLQGFGENRALYVGAIFFLFITIPLPGLIRDLAKIPNFMDLQGNPVGWNVTLESLNQFYVLNEPLMIVTIALLVIGTAELFRYDVQLCRLLLFMIIVPAALSMVLSYWIAFEPEYALLVLPPVCVGAGFSCNVVYFLLSKWIKVSRLQVLVLFLILFSALSLKLV